MLTEKQMKSLAKGEHPNHRLFGANATIPPKVEGETPTPIYYNRKQRRQGRFAKMRNVTVQNITLLKNMADDITSGVIDHVKDCYDSTGKLKAQYNKRIYHSKVYSTSLRGK
jgi:hypothetical protein